MTSKYTVMLLLPDFERSNKASEGEWVVSQWVEARNKREAVELALKATAAGEAMLDEYFAVVAVFLGWHTNLAVSA